MSSNAKLWIANFILGIFAISLFFYVFVLNSIIKYKDYFINEIKTEYQIIIKDTEKKDDENVKIRNRDENHIVRLYGVIENLEKKLKEQKV